MSSWIKDLALFLWDFLYIFIFILPLDDTDIYSGWLRIKTLLTLSFIHCMLFLLPKQLLKAWRQMFLCMLSTRALRGKITLLLEGIRYLKILFEKDYSSFYILLICMMLKRFLSWLKGQNYGLKRWCVTRTILLFCKVLTGA